MDGTKEFVSEPAGKRPGAVHRLYHRINELRPEWELCASIVLIQSLQGDEFYIPAGIFAGRDAQTDRFLPAVTERSFDKRIWTRLPVLAYLANPRRKNWQPQDKSKRIARRMRRTYKTSDDFLRWLRERRALQKQATDENTEQPASPQDGI